MTKGSGFTLGEACFRVAGVGLALLIGFLTGCGSSEIADGYDPALRYPLRSDPLVVQLPPITPGRPADAGKLDDSLLRFPELGGKIITPATISEDVKTGLRQSLDELFGTPAAPTIHTSLDGCNWDLSPDHLAAGSRVYRRLCTSCRGMAGDGRGPTGPWVYPYPRDFRQGVFKATAGHTKPSLDDLARLIRKGVPGTAMQPFDLISEADVRAVTAYSVHLSLRGEVEFQILRTLQDESNDIPVSEIPQLARDYLKKSFADWLRSQSTNTSSDASDPPATEDAIRRGHRLFTGMAGCVSCHTDYGRGDAYRFDIWGGVTRVPDLTRGDFKWGHDSHTIMLRIRNGIPASGMPANPSLTEEQIQDLAHFVRALGYPQRLPVDLQNEIYPSPSGLAKPSSR